MARRPNAVPVAAKAAVTAVGELKWICGKCGQWGFVRGDAEKKHYKMHDEKIHNASKRIQAKKVQKEQNRRKDKPKEFWHSKGSQY